MMTHIVRRVFTVGLILTAVVTLSLGLTQGSDPARADEPDTVQWTYATVENWAAKPIATRLTSARATPKRHIAMRFNYAQRGEWYRYGATGPSTWDCSGLVQAAYRKAGIYLPRTTYDIIKSSKLSRTYSPRWGDIVFTSTGHMEMYVKPGWMHGAHRSGTRIGYKAIYKSGPGWPKYYRVKGAG